MKLTNQEKEAIKLACKACSLTSIDDLRFMWNQVKDMKFDPGYWQEYVLNAIESKVDELKRKVEGHKPIELKGE